MPWEENNNCEGCLESEGVLNAAFSVMSLVASKALSRFLNDNVLMLFVFSHCANGFLGKKQVRRGLSFAEQRKERF